MAEIRVRSGGTWLRPSQDFGQSAQTLVRVGGAWVSVAKNADAWAPNMYVRVSGSWELVDTGIFIIPPV